MAWPCYLAEESGRSAAYLRRYRSDSDMRCPSMEGDHSYHTVSVRVEDVPTTKTEEGYYESVPVENYRDDPRWPTHCTCGYEFDQTNFAEGHASNSDVWQVLTHAMYVRKDGESGEWPVSDLPPGAMFDAFWLPWKGDDGISLSVVLPPDEPDRMNHVWHVDGPSSSGGHWTRSGDPPKVTATPSILTGKYHGFLTDGALTDSLSDRPL